MLQPLSRLDSTQKAILRVEREFVSASMKRNVAKLHEILIDDYAETDCTGKLISKSDFLDLLHRKGHYYHSKSFITQCSVRDQAAIVVGIAVVETELSELCDEVQFTSIYKNDHGVWRMVSTKYDSIE